MSEIFLKVLNMSISATYLVLAVLLLRLVLKKAPKWVSVLLWGIVAVRLMCPFSIESILSLIPSGETVSPEIMMDWTPEIQTGISSLDSVVNPVISETFAPDPLTSANPLQILIPVAAVFWLTGVGIMLIYTAVSFLLLRRKVATAVRLRDRIYQSEKVASPFVLGIIRPKIYLPFAIDGQDMEYVIAHEISHIRRKDHLWKPLGFLILTIHWFNPLMWIGYVFLCRDIELACDEKVIRKLDSDEKANYTQALVACSVGRLRIAACPLAFGEVGIKERVKSVLNYKKPAFWIIVVAIVASIATAVCFLTDPVNRNTDPSDVTDSLTEKFLKGEISATNKEGRKVSIQDYLRGDYNKYALYDMSGDAVPELILKTGNGLTIFSIREQDLTVWYQGAIYAKPLNNRAIFYERPGGAPEHTTYQYIVLDHNGEELQRTSFVESYGDNAEYFINGVRVSKTAYEDLYKSLSLSDDAIVWKDIPAIDETSSEKNHAYRDHQNLLSFQVPFDSFQESFDKDNLPRISIPEVGLKNVFSREVSGLELLDDGVYGQVYLLADDRYGGGRGVSDHYLAIVMNDVLFVEDISKQTPGYTGDIELCDFDGDGDKEILLQECISMTGGAGGYLSRVFDFDNGKLVEMFSFDIGGNKRFDTGFSITILEDRKFKIENKFTQYSDVFSLNNRKDDYYLYWYDKDGKPIQNEILVDSFCDFLPTDVEGDGVWEIACRQYVSLIGHSDGIGAAKTILKYNPVSSAFEVFQTDFEVYGDVNISSLLLDEAYAYAEKQYKEEPLNHRYICDLQPETQQIIALNGKYYQSYVAPNVDIRYIWISQAEFPDNRQSLWDWYPVGSSRVYSLDLLGKIDEGRKGGETDQIDPADMLLLSVLYNNQSFYCYEGPYSENVKHTISDYHRDIWKFTVVDMDGDRKNELAVQFFDGDILLLRQDNGVVCGDLFGMRGMYRIFKNGTFLWNSDAGSINGCSKLRFTEEGAKTIELWRVERDDSGGVTYYVDDKQVTEAEWNAMMQQDNSEEEVWFTYSG